MMIKFPVSRRQNGPDQASICDELGWDCVVFGTNNCIYTHPVYTTAYMIGSFLDIEDQSRNK